MRDNKDGHPTPAQTFPTDSGPFGAIDGNAITNNQAYEQYQWLLNDLKNVDREKTPWVIAMSHRPMYSSQVSSYQATLRKAFESMFLEYGVDLYLSGYANYSGC